MEDLKDEIYDEKNGLWYKREGDYYYPMIKIPKHEDAILGKYGRARLNYIKKNKKGLYAELIMTGELMKKLTEIDKTANERINNIVKDMAKSERTDEELKRTNQLKWVGLMNNYKNCAEEIVYSELIYE